MSVFKTTFSRALRAHPSDNADIAFPGQVNSRLNFWLDRIAFMDQNVVNRSKGKQTLKSYQDAYENELWLTAQKAIEAAGGSIVKL